LTSHDGVLAVSCYFLLCLLGIDEFVSGIASRIKPFHKDRRSSRFRLCQRDAGIIAGLPTFRRNCQKGSVQNSAIRIVDLNNIWFSTTISEFEQVRSRTNTCPGTWMGWLNVMVVAWSDSSA
jgi:hypothetical protein